MTVRPHAAGTAGRTPAAAALVAALVLVGLPSRAWPQVSRWELGGQGAPWRSQSLVALGVDLRQDSILQPYGLSPAENISDLVEWQDISRWSPTLVEEGMAYVSDNSATKVSNLALVDGDPSTTTADRFTRFGANQSGVTFWFDFGAPSPLNRIVFYPRPEERDNFIRRYEVSVSDGRTFARSGDPQYGLLHRQELATDPVADIRFPLQLVRFVQLKVLSRGAFEIAEFEAYGEGFVPQAHFESGLVDFGRAVVFGHLVVDAAVVGPGSGASGEAAAAVLEVRSGGDLTPRVYFRMDVESQQELEVTEAEYEKLEGKERGPVRSDTENWSPWSPPVRLDSTGRGALSLDFLPGPRQYLQSRVTFTGTSTRAVQLTGLSVAYSGALAQTVLGEVAVDGAPRPPAGVAEAAAGVDTVFAYDVQAAFRSSQERGFDGIRIRVPTAPTLVSLEMGDPPGRVEPDSVRSEPDQLAVYFPSSRVTRQRNPRVRVRFRSAPLLYTTVFSGWVLDTAGGFPQVVLAGDASEGLGTGSLTVFGHQAGDPSVSLDVFPAVFTPNDDGVNDSASLTLIVTQLVVEVETDLIVRDLAGAPVRRLLRERVGSGKREIPWDGRDDDGRLLPPGQYLCEASAKTDAKAFTQLRVIGLAY
ncbi:MAG: FlgD immunoglobulin-like domain containing protein [Candidatus Latescibacterota bacterium]